VEARTIKHRVSVEDIVTLWREGLTDREIAEKLAVNPSTINYWRRKLKLPANRKNLISKEELQKLVDKGYSLRRLARELNHDISTIKRYLNLYGIEVKYKGRGRRVNFDVEKFLIMYRRGLSDKEIARIMGVSISCVYRWRRKFDLPPNRRRTRRERAKKLVNEFMTNRDVCVLEELVEYVTSKGISYSTFYGVLKDMRKEGSLNIIRLIRGRGPRKRYKAHDLFGALTCKSLVYTNPLKLIDFLKKHMDMDDSRKVNVVTKVLRNVIPYDLYQLWIKHK